MRPVCAQCGKDMAVVPDETNGQWLECDDCERYVWLPVRRFDDSPVTAMPDRLVRRWITGEKK